MLEIAKKIKQAGGTLYLVGGAIRNQLLNMPVIDEDYCVTGLSKEQFQILLREHDDTRKLSTPEAEAGGYVNSRPGSSRWLTQVQGGDHLREV